MKVESNPNVQPYIKTDNTTKPIDLQNQNPDYDSVEISTEETQEQDTNASYIMYIKEIVARNRENSALSNILKNVSGQNKEPPSPEKIREICMEIASRIQKGDNVPIKDLQYLLKKDPKLYQLAMLNIKPNDNPKKWKQISPDEEQDEIIASLNSGVNNPSTENVSNIAISLSDNKTN